MKILLLGAGGREHALAWKISQSPLCSRLYIAPGNAGTALCGENISLSLNDFETIGDFVRSQKVEMVIAGPEEPLVKGIADYFADQPGLEKVLFVGPPEKGAKLEGSKAFAKSFMQRNHIPTAAHRAFTITELEEGKTFLRSLAAPYVLKADGLAAGKGVVICNTIEEAEKTIEKMLRDELFGRASATVVIEEFLSGRELSVFAITDGKDYKLLPSAKDYKRIGEKNTGPNTGGMGAVSPVPFADKVLMGKIEQRIIKPTIEGLQKENIPYCGFLFFGLMEVKGEPYVIEYNVRLGDPEAETILPLIETDFVRLLLAAAQGNLSSHELSVSPKWSTTVILASGGYPGVYEKGFKVENTREVNSSRLFFAGITREGDVLKTNGGRVIAVNSIDDTLEKALKTTYDNARKIDFMGKYFRRDIGKDLL